MKIRRILLSCLLFLALVFQSVGISSVFAETLPESIEMKQPVKVGLRYGSNAVSSFELSCDGGFMIAESCGTGLFEIRQVTYKTALTVVSESGSVVAKDKATGEVIAEGLTENNCILPLYYSDGYVMSIDGTKYRGGACFTLNGSGSMNLINCLSADEYVCGVLNAELNYTNPIEALKAQAVVARSFAVASALERNRHADSGFDVCASTHCQVYRGYGAETDTTNKAVTDTAGLCLYYDGKPVVAYYHKNSGGCTQDVGDVWGSKSGYLKAVEDMYSPKYYWEQSYSFAELEAKLSADGKRIGSLQQIEITEQNDNGCVKKIRFSGSSGSCEYSGESIRTLLGTTNIKSMNFVFSGTVTESRASGAGGEAGAGGTAPVSNGLFIMDGSGTVSSINDRSKTGIYAADGSGNAVKLTGTKVYIADGSGTFSADMGGSASGAEPPSQGNTTEYVKYIVSGKLSEASGSVTFTGLGYGHGVGMPQDSAVQMAKEGFTYEDILLYYYTDIDVR